MQDSIFLLQLSCSNGHCAPITLLADAPFGHSQHERPTLTHVACWHATASLRLGTQTLPDRRTLLLRRRSEPARSTRCRRRQAAPESPASVMRKETSSWLREDASLQPVACVARASRPSSSTACTGQTSVT